MKAALRSAAGTCAGPVDSLQFPLVGICLQSPLENVKGRMSKPKTEISDIVTVS